MGKTWDNKKNPGMELVKFWDRYVTYLYIFYFFFKILNHNQNIYVQEAKLILWSAALQIMIICDIMGNATFFRFSNYIFFSKDYDKIIWFFEKKKFNYFIFYFFAIFKNQITAKKLPVILNRNHQP